MTNHKIKKMTIGSPDEADRAVRTIRELEDTKEWMQLAVNQEIAVLKADKARF